MSLPSWTYIAAVRQSTVLESSDFLPPLPCAAALAIPSPALDMTSDDDWGRTRAKSPNHPNCDCRVTPLATILFVTHLSGGNHEHDSQPGADNRPNASRHQRL